MRIVLVAVVLTVRLLFTGPGAERRVEQSPAWQVSVPDGTPILEYHAVLPEERHEQITLIEDLLVTERGGRGVFPNLVQGLATDTTGNLYVAKWGQGVVEVYSEEGVFIRAFGRPTGGVADFLAQPQSVAVSGGTVVIQDRGDREFSVWGLDGVHKRNYPMERRPPWIMGMTRDGDLICLEANSGDSSGRRRLVAVDLTGNEVREYFDFGYEVLLYETADGRKGYDFFDESVLIPRDRPRFAVAGTEWIYAKPAGTYEVVSKSVDGSIRWVLRVPGDRRPFQPTRELVDRVMWEGRLNPRSPLPSELIWPASEPVIERIDVDGRGNLYVFPWVDPLSAREARPVDVYSPAGKRIFAGLIRDVDWGAAFGDYVYAVENEPETRIQRVVRYRLVLPGRSRPRFPMSARDQ